jgi:cob(I)alamin adenosyltransferase
MDFFDENSVEKRMKLYTGGGDRRKTSLFSGERVSKSSARVEAYGDLDELNSVVGALAATLAKENGELSRQLARVQSALFSASAWLAVSLDSDSASMLERFSSEHTASLERSIDAMEEKLSPLKEFILPVGSQSSAWAHIARSVCRRAERHVIFAIERSGPQGQGWQDENLGNVLVFLNRLSDYFFSLARYLNKLSGIEDVLWKK